MYIHTFQIKNFKSFKDVTFYFNKDLNILTGINNSGKTTVLEALSLWQECFTKLITEAKRGEHGYKRGDYILGPSNNKYFRFEEINSVRSPNFEDIFHQIDKKNAIQLSLTIKDDENVELCITFKISSSGNNYVIELVGYSSYDHRTFNDYFAYLPNPISLIYSTPVSQISLREDFMTEPIVKEQLLLRRSDVVLRNRLYKIISGTNATINTDFQSDLSYILFNSEKQIEFNVNSNILKDPQAIIHFRVGSKDVYKDLSLLGSGSLQIIGILLNLYSPIESKTDLKLVLLDEPDSHIHRDLQKRLIEVLNKFGRGIQIFVTTHNESLIRSAEPAQVFHLEGKATGEFKSIHFNELGHLGLHFKGIMPSNLTPVIRSIGDTTGLDFINALEADKLIFVEGQDDAQVFRILLNQQLNTHKKYMFWVLGGISEVFENINSYKSVFSTIKNGKTLWDKSVLIFDKDELSNEHKDLFIKKFKDKLDINAYCCESYTFESTLFTDLQKTSKLLSKFIERTTGMVVAESVIFEELTESYLNYETVLTEKFTSEFYKSAYNRLRYAKVKKANEIFGQIIKMDDYTFTHYTPNYYSEAIASKHFYKLMDKMDVGNVIRLTVEKYNCNFLIESYFIELIKLVDKSTWIEEWDFLNTI